MRRIYRILRFDWPLHFVLMLTNWLPDNVIFLRLRGFLASPFFGACGTNFRIGRGITFYNPSKINIGNDVYVAYGCWFMADAEIHIGDEVMFGPYCVIVSSNHSKKNHSFRYGNTIPGPIKIGRGSWIAGHVTITANVEIGEGVLVAAGAVVTSSLEDGVLAAGQPAKAK